MLDQVRFSFEIELLSFMHVGDGRTKELPKEGNFATIQRGVDNVPVIEGTSLRGAIRNMLRLNGQETLANALLGLEDIDENTLDGEGAMRLHGGFLANQEGISSLDLCLPHWNTALCPCSFILPAIRSDVDAGVTEDKHLYFVEMLPDGCRFRFTGTFLGTRDDFLDQAEPMFSLLASEDGFELGCESGYWGGVARLDPESISFETRSYNVTEKDFDVESDIRLPITPAVRTTCVFSLTLDCAGPYFILAPLRAQSEDADMVALMRDCETPVFTGKQFLQDLRRRSAWRESLAAVRNNAFDYAEGAAQKDDMDRQLRASDSPKNLTITQRLFGVAGWGKRVRIRRVAVEWPEKENYRGQGIKLDVFTQGPIDTALIEYDVPAGVCVTIDLALDRRGLEPGDEAHLDAVLNDLCNGFRRPRYGHATGTGFGSFVCGTGDAS